MAAEFDKPGSFMLKTLAMLREDKNDLLTIHKETGLPFYWLRQLMTGKTKNPAINRMQCLYEYYTKKPLNLG